MIIVLFSQQETDFFCIEEELCIAEIHLKESLIGKCVELKFEGSVDVLFTTTYKNVCVSEMPGKFYFFIHDIIIV